MSDLFIFLLPAAVFTIAVLFRFAGCSFSAHVGGEAYPDVVKNANPVRYYRLQETGGMLQTAVEEIQMKNGNYSVSPLPLNDPAYLSRPVTPSPPLGGSPSIVPGEPGATAVRFHGGDMSATGPIWQDSMMNDLPRFSVEAIVRPEWGVNSDQGWFFCVFQSWAHIPGLGAPTPLNNAGFAIFAGPHDLNDPTHSAYCWQLWVGNGMGFERAFPDQGAVPLVKSENTYLAVTLDDSQAFIYAYTPGDDLHSISHELARPAYRPAKHGQNDTSLLIGMAGGSAALVKPFPGPAGLLYPFDGRMAEVAIYETVLTPDRIKSHIRVAFKLED